MITIRFRNTAPLAALMMLVSAAPVDVARAGESDRNARLQAAESAVGAPKRQAEERTPGAPQPQGTERDAAAKQRKPASGGAEPAPAGSTRTAAPDTGAVKPAAAKTDSAGPAKAARSGAGHDSTASRGAAGKEEQKEEPQVRGPRLPIWPGISLANPSADHEKLAAAW